MCVCVCSESGPRAVRRLASSLSLSFLFLSLCVACRCVSRAEDLACMAWSQAPRATCAGACCCRKYGGGVGVRDGRRFFRDVPLREARAATLLQLFQPTAAAQSGTDGDAGRTHTHARTYTLMVQTLKTSKLKKDEQVISPTCHSHHQSHQRLILPPHAATSDQAPVIASTKSSSRLSASSKKQSRSSQQLLLSLYAVLGAQ